MIRLRSGRKRHYPRAGHLPGDRHLDTITQSRLGLMRISAGTALAGAVIDNQKRDAATAQLAKFAQTASAGVNPPAGSPPAPPDRDQANPASVNSPPLNTTPPATDAPRQVQEQLEPGVSEGFLRDILSDGRGCSLHRFQMVAWTVALAVFFSVDTYKTSATSSTRSINCRSSNSLTP